MTLLRAARAAGLTVEADGDKLVIRGPKSADATARLLIEHKADVLPLVRGDYWHQRSDRERFATGETDPRPAYTPSDAPLPEPDTVDMAALDLLILSCSCGRRGRMLRALGECPSEIATQIKNNLVPVVKAVGPIEESQP